MNGEIKEDNLLLKENVTYEYDYEDRLIGYEDGTNTITYTYDGDGNLIGKTIIGEINESKTYYYDHSKGLPRLLVEKNSNGDTNQYLYAGRLYSRVGAEGQVYYHQDGLGSTIAITDHTGQIQNEYQYDEFGSHTALQENIENNMLYTGELLDESGLYYLRARYYDPKVGRFTTEDTLFGEIHNPITQNLYIYVGNNPILYIDPSGHRMCKADYRMVTRTYPHNDEFNDYLLRSGEQIVLGNFSDEVTLLGTGGQVLAGASGVDFLMDARDIGYDVVNWEWSWRHAGKTTIDIIAIVPVVGALKYSDEVSALVKGTVKGTGKISNAFSRSIKSVDEMNTSVFKDISFEGVVDVGRSGSKRPFYSKANSYYKTKGGNILVYDDAGKLIYDVNSQRVKMFDLNVNQAGQEFFNPRKLDGVVPDSVMELIK